MEKTNQPLLSHAELLELKRWNTPTIYNGWEQITKSDAGKDAFNLEECRTMIAAANNSSGLSTEEILQAIDTACDKFTMNAKERFGRKGK